MEFELLPLGFGIIDGQMVKSKTALEPKKDVAKARTSGSILLISALDMSWRLAITVLVPIVGGFELDKRWNTKPTLTIIGFLIAMVGVFLILKRAVANANDEFRSNGATK